MDCFIGFEIMLSKIIWEKVYIFFYYGGVSLVKWLVILI